MINRVMGLGSHVRFGAVLVPSTKQNRAIVEAQTKKVPTEGRVSAPSYLEILRILAGLGEGNGESPIRMQVGKRRGELLTLSGDATNESIMTALEQAGLTGLQVITIQ